MAQIDTLKTFDELVSAGTPPEQARRHASILDAAFDGVATKEDLKIFLMYGVGGTFLVVLAFPFVGKILG